MRGNGVIRLRKAFLRIDVKKGEWLHAGKREIRELWKVEVAGEIKHLKFFIIDDAVIYNIYSNFLETAKIVLFLLPSYSPYFSLPL